jgi:hypothetical protein
VTNLGYNDLIIRNK